MTPAELAATCAHVMAVEYGELAGKRVLDLGCGTGMLSAAVLAYGAKEVVGVDIDQGLCELYCDNLAHVSDEPAVFVHRDVVNDSLVDLGEFDVAVVNPPFGTKNNEGIDVVFLEKALSCARVVYSMHKSSTREYFRTKYAGRIKFLSQMKFEIPKSYSFHRKESVHVLVDLIRVENRVS
ncbi:rRNA N6-adenosine-methyltransferase METTL5 [Nematocida homosporus]|uniref:rRNA N6-adenosine-methyltransferase METTL5 n=1 Tax=Nematocida homosporus TaxID=1912981 RepID=UPI00221FDA3F|nr:rRNA N6-adenosine-methyltransferase METTL5 [Nematocida homosporus]KAI5186161.1 rRNA N6-adenosine-methyltransferase METTL5 [Nematocida homosporus]